MRKVFLILFSFFATALLAQQKSLRIDYPDTTISYQLYYKSTDSLVQNKLKAFYAQDTSILAIEKNYHYGNTNGIYRSFYPNGSVNVFCIYQQGLIHGDWTKYDEFGNIIIKAKYVNGQKHGFYINRKERYQGRYRNGKKHGKWEYNLNSLNYYKRFYDNGELADKRPISLLPNKSDKPEAEVIQVWEEKEFDTIYIESRTDTNSYRVKYLNRDSLNHSTMRKAVFLDSLRNTALIKYIYGGKTSGNYKLYYPNGQLYKHTFYKHGILDGDCRIYSEEGELRTLGKYRSGKKHGKWKYEIGTDDYFVEIYKRGELEKSIKPK